ncbi:MAG: hypothetical protein ACPG5P_08675 [Saprospiraceae bacterium]
MGVQNFTDTNVGVNHKRTVASQITPSEVFEKLGSNSHFKKMQMKEGEFGIKIHSGATWKSWGEEMSILSKSTTNGFEYHIESRPILKTTLVDYGRNLKNITEFVRLIKEAA